jgi:hypothetical protein
MLTEDEISRNRTQHWVPSKYHPKPTPVMNALLYGWTTVSSLFSILIAVLILRAAVSSSETIIYSVLIMIYVKVRVHGSGIVLFMSNEALVGNRRHTRLLDLLGSPQSAGESRNALEATHSIEEAELSRTKNSLLIEACSLHLIGAGAAVYLVFTLAKSL